MRKYRDEDIESARKLRQKEGYSFAHLQRLTGIPATTIRNWCRDDYIGTRWDTLLKTNERKRQAIKTLEKEIFASGVKLDKLNAKLFASLIYWCEGSKYPATNKVYLTNSDPELLRSFILLLRKGFDLDESKFRLHLQLHTTHSIPDMIDFWSRLLSVPISQFIKPTITKPNGGKHRREYFGTCTVRYLDYKIQLRLIGIYESLAKNLKI